MTRSISSGCSVSRTPASRSARSSGSSAMAKTVWPGASRVIQSVVVWTVLTTSVRSVAIPSPSSFSTYAAGSRVGLLETKTTRRSRSRSASSNRRAPGSAPSPRYRVPSRSKA